MPGDLAGIAHTRGVHENLRLAEPRLQGIERPVQARLVGDIALFGGKVQFFDHRGAFADVDVEYADPRALIGQRTGGGAADPAHASGDPGYLPVEIAHAAYSRSHIVRSA